jgi:hypothetical protein
MSRFGERRLGQPDVGFAIGHLVTTFSDVRGGEGCGARLENGERQ